MRAPVLISIEGIHGAGKTTVAQHVTACLVAQGKRTMLSQDQIGTRLSQQIRQVNLEVAAFVDFYTETFLVAAARRQTFVEVIKPSLVSNNYVVTERFTDSFFAFGSARDMPREFIDLIAQSACGGVVPNLTLVLDLEPTQALGRIPQHARHRVEREGINFHERLRQGYLDQAKRFPDRVRVLDARPSAEVVLERAWQTVHERLKAVGLI